MIRESIDGERESWLDLESLQTLRALLLNSNAQSYLYGQLKIIDELWKKYSGGKFSFSTQNKIFLKSGGKQFLKSGGKQLDMFNNIADENQGIITRKSFQEFGDRTGLREKSEWYRTGKRRWIYYDNLTFSDLSPEGHLPLPRIKLTGFWGKMMSITSSPLTSDAEQANPDVQISATLCLILGFWLADSK